MSRHAGEGARDRTQPFFAPSACAWKPAASMPGTSPSTSRSICVMVGPASVVPRCTLAFVLMLVGVMPGAAERGGQRHRKAARVRRANQFFRIGAGAVLEPGHECVRSFERAAAQAHAAGAFLQRAFPLRTCRAPPLCLPGDERTRIIARRRGSEVRVPESGPGGSAGCSRRTSAPRHSSAERNRGPGPGPARCRFRLGLANDEELLAGLEQAELAARQLFDGGGIFAQPPRVFAQRARCRARALSSACSTAANSRRALSSDISPFSPTIGVDHEDDGDEDQHVAEQTSAAPHERAGRVRSRRRRSRSLSSSSRCGRAG